ncbi:MAG: helix-turn-helix domain-containing protein [bacterium]|nr:helix-turn-helix domain-containing protein [bacterium]
MSLRKRSIKKTPYKTSVSKRLEILRPHLGLGINAMAARMKVTPWTYRAYMRGESIPSVDGVVLLAGTANVSLDWLLMGKGGMFYRDVEQETERALQAERNAIETRNTSDFLLSELEEMKRLMQQVPLVRHMVLGYYQKVKVEQKEIIQQETQKTVHRTSEVPPAVIHEMPEPPPAVVHKEPEAPTTIIHKQSKPPPAVVHKEPEAPTTIIHKQPEPPPAVVHKEPEAPPAVINKKPEPPTDAVPKAIESPDTVNKDPVKGAPGVQKLFPKKRKKKRKKK